MKFIELLAGVLSLSGYAQPDPGLVLTVHNTGWFELRYPFYVGIHFTVVFFQFPDIRISLDKSRMVYSDNMGK